MIRLKIKPTEIKFLIDELAVNTVGVPYKVKVKDEDGNETDVEESKQLLYYELSGPHPENEGERLTPERKNAEVNPMVSLLLLKVLENSLTSEETQIINQLLQSFNPTFQLEGTEEIEEPVEEIVEVSAKKTSKK